MLKKILLLAFGFCLFQNAEAGDYFAIQVVDRATRRGVPLVRLRTVNGIEYDTDSAGWVAFNEPGLMNREVFFSVHSDGYEFDADGFGIRGKRLTPVPGESAVLTIKRINLAERLYRVTGGGIYNDSIRLRKPVPIEAPVLNAGVLGSDSVLCAPFQGKLYWFWGDTNLPGYPLGLFHTPGATSPLPGKNVLSPAQGVNLNYFCDPKGQARNTAELPGSGPTWLGGLTVLKDGDGKERMFAGYAKIKTPLEVYERGIVEFNPDTAKFEHRATLSPEAFLYPDGHPVQAGDNGVDYVYFARPFADVRVRATIGDFLNPASYEAFTCLAPGSTRSVPKVERDADGKPVYAWKRGVPSRDWQQEQQLLAANELKESELHNQLKDVDTGKPLIAHSGSIAWNEYRQRYTMIVLESMGTSGLGEIWYAESKQVTGPWSAARKVVTHENYSFYNPLQHPLFAEEGGRRIYFEGTYTNSFSGNPVQTPRYDYNQVMYRLDLTNEQLHLDRE